MNALTELNTRLQIARGALGGAKSRLNKQVLADLEGRGDGEALRRARHDVDEAETTIQELEQAREPATKLVLEAQEAAKLARRAGAAQAVAKALSVRQAAAEQIDQAFASIKQGIETIARSDIEIAEAAYEHLAHPDAFRQQERRENLTRQLGREHHVRWMLGAVYESGIRDATLANYATSARGVKLGDIVDHAGLRRFLSEALPELKDLSDVS
ncbi:hypothetical protein [Sphingomonas qomolangmaensis]|uniref:V-type ATP synthase subunit E n=1 Tax=Sphingomonas qomolangmaensis TaxID=2918765 RepID=A0ABY5LCN7_9SPHN|nr:hypothetical protein [Sphingomonas qomolangmaensis]UUL83448.1 hypothetical protein NMP03_04255 [Sphingomonas qomolangmaensis]